MKQAGWALSSFAAPGRVAHEFFPFASIRNAVCLAFDVPVEQLTRNRTRRYQSAIYARHIICYLSARHTAMSSNQIARELGYTDHSTVGYAQKKIAELAETNHDIAHVLDQLVDQLHQEHDEQSVRTASATLHQLPAPPNLPEHQDRPARQ